MEEQSGLSGLSDKYLTTEEETTESIAQTQRISSLQNEK